MSKIIQKVFVWSEDPTDNEYPDGWLEEGAPHTYFPAGGVTVAHDLLEHKLHPKYGLEDELMAFGAILFIRGEGGYWAGRLHPSYSGNVAGELAEMLNRYDGEVKSCRQQKELHSWAESEIENALTATKESYADELEKEPPEEATLQRVANWLRVGYQWAKLRYPEGSYPTCCLFNMVEERVDRVGSGGYYGQRIQVTVNTDMGTVYVDLIEDEEEY